MVDPEALRILMQRVALKAARRYEFFISAELTDNPVAGVTPFAKAGVERIQRIATQKTVD